ncbi:PhnA domain-containing protein [Acidimangrovimonas pyrenivorans]|uniref:PhnA domain-containing protein n=1 Tax=Acidimangrovimonas pyrenivorans TaxID=2030798 RepID=A0ABV7ACL4_9RHOB
MPTCALCHAEDATPYAVVPRDETVMLCATCRAGIEDGPQDGPHWQCLNEAIWSTEPAVQVLAYRLLKALPEAPWARDVLEIAYLEPEVLSWAEAGLSAEPEVVHRDSNGAVLASGDTVVLIKDLPVKGAGFTAKRGTAVRNISLVPDNAEHIEGRVEGQRIVILTQFVKKS